MGLYSTNRVSGLTEASNIELVPDSSFGDIMECNIQLCEHERMMFESLIELDFVSATNEAVLTEAEAEEKNNAADDKKKVKITEKISHLIDKAIVAIKKAFANFIAKFQELSRDHVIKKYGEAAMKDGALNGFKGFDCVKPKHVVKLDGKAILDINNGTENQKTLNEKLAEIDKATTVEEVNNIEALKVEEVKEEDEFEEVQGYIPNTDGVKKCLELFKGSAKVVAGAKATYAQIERDFKHLKQSLKSSTKSANGEVEVAKAKKKYDIAVDYIKATNKEVKQSMEFAKKNIAFCRKTIVLCGKYALSNKKGSTEDNKNAEQTATEESALDYIIGESSDQYVYNLFA